MRPSSKVKLLDAAVTVVSREGIAGLTLDGVAGEAGLTKAGLLYHFASRDIMVRAVQDHLLGRLEDQMLAALGEPLESATPERRLEVYATTTSATAMGEAELRFMLESLAHPDLAEPWDALMERWAPRPADASAAAVDRFMVRMALDGLWLFDSTSTLPLDPAVREALVARVTGLLDGPTRPVQVRPDPDS